MIIKNDAREIEKKLNLDEGSCIHIGSFNFEAMKEYCPVRIFTEPVEDTQDRIRILSIYFLVK